MGGLVGDPAGLLGVIGLGLKLDLQLRRDNQPRGWIWIGSIRLLDITGHVRSLFGSNLKILKKIGFIKTLLKVLVQVWQGWGANLLPFWLSF
jgi:hypothetical protein